MATQTQIGYVSGTLERLTLRVTVYDDATPPALIDYADAVAAAQVGIPPSIAGLFPGEEPKDVGLRERSGDIYEFEFTYMPTETIDSRPPIPPATGTTVRKAACIAKAVKRSRFLDPIGVYATAAGTDLSAFYSHSKYIIGTPSGDGSKEKTFQPLAETRHRDYYPANATVTDALLKQIEELVGTFNDAVYDGRPIGSTQLVRFNATPRNRGDWEFSYGFGYQAEQNDYYVSGDVKIPKLRACDHFWTKDKPSYDPATKILQPKTEYAVVGRVWEFGDFTQLGLP